MWVKFKKHFSRSKGYESESPPQQPNNINRGSIVLKSFRKIPSSYVGFGDGELINTEQIPLTHDSPDTCKCAPQTSLHKQLLSSFKNKRPDDSLDSCSVPNIENVESEDPRVGCVSTFKSAQLDVNNALSPKSLHQSWTESPKRGCFTQGCILNSDGCRRSPVLDNQVNGSDPVMCERYCDDTRTENQIYNNNEFQKVSKNDKFSSSSYPVNKEYEDTGNDEMEQLEEQVHTLNVDAYDDDYCLDEVVDTRRIKANDFMTTSGVANGGKVSPPKMRRREKARPVSALEPRKNHIQPPDFSSVHTRLPVNKPEILCPVSKNCIPNIADILDDAVYCMDVSNSLSTDSRGQDLCLQNVRKSIKTNSFLPQEMLCKPNRMMLEHNDGENAESAHDDLTKNGSHTDQVAEKDELNGNESGYTTLEDVQMLIGPASVINSILDKAVTEEGQQHQHLSVLDHASRDLIIDYSKKSVHCNDSGYQELNKNCLQGRQLQDGILSSKQRQDRVWPIENQIIGDNAVLLSSEYVDSPSLSVEKVSVLSHMFSTGAVPASEKHSNIYMEPVTSNEVVDLRKGGQKDTNYHISDEFHLKELNDSSAAAKDALHCSSNEPVTESYQVLNDLVPCKQSDHWSNEIYFGQDFGNPTVVGEVKNGTEATVIPQRFDSSSELDQEVDSDDDDDDDDDDDGEYLPPLPSRNYVTYVNSSAAVMTAREKKVANETSEVRHEQTHMTWEEIMQEARSLGIPLNGPPTESLGRVSSVSSMTSSQFSLGSEDFLSSPVPETVSGCPQDREVAGGGLPPEMIPKRDGSSKEKFRPFSRKNRNGNHSQLASNNAVIQNRCLPPVPLAGNVGNADLLSSSSRRHAQPPSLIGKSTRRTLSNVHLSESDRGSVWGSSMSVPAQCMSSTNGSSGSVRSLFSNISNGSSPGSSSALANSCSGTSGDLNKSFVQLKDCGWYWGPLGWENAEAMLGDKPDGSFLVRDSSDDRYILSLSFRSQGVTHHTRIEHYKGMFSFYSQPKSHGAATIVEFIERAMEHSRSGKFLYFLRPRAPGHAPAPVQLLHPVSRMQSMHSLQHICRFQIVRIVRRDLIDRLPIPPRLKEYLKQTQYYVEGDATGEHQYLNQDW